MNVLFRRSTILVKLKGNGSALSYEPGDHLAVFPKNDPDLVDSVLNRLDDKESIDPLVPCQLEYLNGNINGCFMIYLCFHLACFKYLTRTKHE